MKRRLKNITSILFLLILFFPTAAKLGHHHHHSAIQDIHKGYASLSLKEICPICNFEFSSFVSDNAWQSTGKAEFGESLDQWHTTACFPARSEYSFLLRAPPGLQPHC